MLPAATSSTCLSHMLCLRVGCGRLQNTLWEGNLPPFQGFIFPPTTIWLFTSHPCFQILIDGYFAVKPEGGGGSEDGSDMEAEPGIPLKVNHHFSPLLKCSCLIHLLLLIPSEPPPLPGLKSTSPAQAEEVSHHVHSLPAGRAGEGVREDPVPGHLHQGGAQSEDQAQ